ncbi:MAG: cation:proton antiporter [Rhodospirillaceae bacterium]|nr:cation:proton antiporter [Rhodospirillaceae bacterium]
MHLDPILPVFVLIILILTGVAAVARWFHQPLIVGYLIAGLLMGPAAFGLINDTVFLARLGAVGVVLLMFFVGMEVSPGKLIENWKVAVLGTIFQVSVSVGLMVAFGTYQEWPLNRSILLGFVISLSSTAVVLKLLDDWKITDTQSGRDALGILIVQDIAVIPMLIIIGMLGGAQLESATLMKQGIGATILLGVVAWVSLSKNFRFPFPLRFKNDREFQVLTALLICLGFSVISGLLELSTALGAFIGGMVVRAARDTQWIDHSLHGFRVIFIALFFASVGALLDLHFLTGNWGQILLLVGIVILVNTFVNAAALVSLGRDWKKSLYTGAILSQIGEFSFVLAAVGFQMGIVGEFAYQMSIAVIVMSLLLSPAWIYSVELFLKIFKTRAPEQ